MCREGMNLSNIESVAICQLDSTSKRFIQESGRGLRAKGYPEIHIFYVENTVDDLFMQNSIQEINSNICLDEKTYEKKKWNNVKQRERERKARI